MKDRTKDQAHAKSAEERELREMPIETLAIPGSPQSPLGSESFMTPFDGDVTLISGAGQVNQDASGEMDGTNQS